MKVCISPQSLKLLATYFNKNIPNLVNSGQTYNQIIKELYTKALSDLKVKPGQVTSGDFSIEELVLQHLTIVPQLLITEIDNNPLLANDSLKQEVEKANLSIITATKNDKESAFASVVNNIAQSLGIKEITAPIGNAVVGRWEAIRLPLYAIINQEATWDEEKQSYKGNQLKDPKKIFTANVQRSVINDGNKLNYRLKMVKKEDVINDPNAVFGFDSSEIANVGMYVLVLVDKTNNIALFDEQGNASQKGKFPILNIKGRESQFEYQRENYVRSEIAKGVTVKDAEKEFDNKINEYLGWLNQSIAKVRNNEGVYFNINLGESSTGNLERNTKLQSNLSDVKNIDTLDFEIKQIGASRNASIKIPNYHTTIAVYEKPFESLGEKQIALFIELLTNNSVFITAKERARLISSYMPMFSVGVKGRVPFNVDINPKNGQVGGVTFNGVRYVISGSSVKGPKKEENIKALTEAFLGFISTYQLIPIGENFPRPLNYVPLEGTAEQVLSKVTSQQEYVIVNGTPMLAMKPTVSQGVFPDVSTIDSGMIYRVVGVNVNGKKFDVEVIPLKDYLIENMYTDVVVNDSNELHSYFPYIAFKPEVTIEDIDAEIDATKFQSLDTPIREDNILSGLNWTEETLAMDWLKDSGWLNVLQLVMTGKEHSKGPQFIASFLQNTISLFKGSNLTDAYHEVFHSYFDGLLTQSERDGVYQELRSKNKGTSFTVNVNGVKKVVPFEDASNIEIEEFLAEEFRRYARSKSIYNKKQKNTKVGRFFAKLFDLLNKMFGRRSYAEVVGLNFVSEDVQTLLKNLYESKDAKGNSLTFSDFIVPKTNYEKFQSLEVDSNKIEMTNAELQKAMSAMSALYVRFIDSVVNPIYKDKQTKNKAVAAFLDVARTQPGRAGYEETLRNRKLAFIELKKQSEGSSGVNTMGVQTDSFMLVSALEYIKLRLEQIRSSKKQAQLTPVTESITNAEDILMLDKTLKYFGDFSLISGEEGFGAIKNSNDTLMAIFLNNFTPIGMDKITESEEESDILVSDQSENRANDPDLAVDQTWNLERKDPSLEKDLDKFTTFLLSTLSQYEDSGRSELEVESSLGLQELLPIKIALVKVANAISNKGTTEESMYDALVKASKDDFSLRQLINRLGNPRNPNITAFEVEQWGEFLRSMNKMTIKPIFYSVEKIDNDDEETSKLEGKFGKTHNKTSFQLKKWGFAFQNNITNSSVTVDSPYNPQLTEAGEFVFGLDPQAFSEKWRAPIQGRQRYLTDPVGMLNDLGLNLSTSAQIQEALLKGNSEYSIDPKILLYILESIENRITAIKESDRIITTFNQLSSSFSYTNAKGVKTEQDNLKTFYKDLANFSLLVDENSMSFMEYTPDGERISIKTLHSSLSIEVLTINAAERYEDLWTIPGMEHFNYETNPEIAANVTFVQMFRLNLPTNHPDYGKRNTNISFTLDHLTGAQVIYKGKEKGVRSIKSDEKTKFNTDFPATLRNRQEILRSEAKSTAVVVHMPILKKGETVVRSGVWIDNNEAEQIFADNYKGTYLFDIFKYQIESELVRMFRLQAIQQRIDAGETVLFDKAFLDRGKSWFKFELLLSNNVKQRLIDLKVSNSFTLEESLKTDPTLIADIETDLVDYFAFRANSLHSEKDKSLVIDDNLLKEYELESDTEYATRMRMFRVFTINNYIQNLNYASTFLGDPSNYNVAALAFHKRIAGKIGSGRIMRHSQMWYNFVNSDKFERDGYSKMYFNSLTEEQKANRNLESTYQNREYKGYLRTAILQEAVTNSIYRKHYNSLLGIPEDKYEGMKEGDGAAYVSFDTYRLLAKSHQEWSPQQEDLYQRMMVDDNINELEITTTFPVRKYQYYGPVSSEDITQDPGLQLIAFHKYAVIPLVPTLIKGTPLQDVHEMMMEQGLDYVTFKTGSKLTDVARIDKDGSKYDAPYKIEEIDGVEERVMDRSVEFTVNKIHVRHLKSVVQMSEGYHGTSLFPSQMRKLILTGLFDENEIPTDYKGRKKWSNLTYTEQLAASANFTWSQEYKIAVDGMIELSKEDLLEDLGLSRVIDAQGNLSFSGGTKKFAEYLREQLTNKQLTAEEIDFIYDKETKELIPDLSLSLNASKIEEVLIKLADDSLRRMEFRGEALVQIPGTMFEGVKPTMATEDDVFAYGNNGLSTYYGVKEDGTVATAADDISYVKSMEIKIALQGDFKKLLYLDFQGEPIMQYRLSIDEKTMQVKEVVDFNASLDRLNQALLDKEWSTEYKEMITIPATRIPTSQFSMLESATIKQFLRPSAGPIVILPSEIVAKSGSDFDIDKLFALFSNIVSAKDKVKLAEYIPGIKETRFQLAEDVTAANLKVDKVRDEINKLYDQKKAIFDNKEENKDNINEKLQSKYDILNDLRTQRKELREEAKLVYAGEGQYQGWNQSDKLEYHHGANGSVFKNKILNERIDNLMKEIQVEYGDELTALYSPIDAKIKNLEEGPLVQAEDQLETAKVRLYGKSKKAIQNKIVSLMNQRITNKAMFGRLVEPNSTDFFDDLAKEMETALNKQYNKYDSSNVDDMRSNRSVVNKSIANSTIFDYRYNLSVHQENSRGLEALGVAAVTSTYYALFTQFGATLNGLSPTQQLLYNKYLFTILNPKEFSSNEVTKATTELSKFKSYTIKFPHQNIDNKVALSFINNIEGRPIQDVIGQLINGFVDVATKPWVFNVQGNMENVPQMLLMVMSGMKVEDIVYFASTPLVLEYNNLKAEMKGPFSKLSSEYKKDEEAFVVSSNVAYDARQMMLDKYEDQLSVTKGMKNLNAFMGNSLNPALLSKDGYLKSKVAEEITDENIDEHYQLLAHYLQIEDMAQDFTDFTMATKFDTKKPQSNTEYQDRKDTIQSLKESESSIPNKWFDKLLNRDENGVMGSILGSFNQDDFIINLIKERFLIRNHPYLIKRSLSTGRPKGIKKEIAFVAFKDDFAFYLYQNSFFKNNSYDNFKFIEDSSLSVILDVRGDEIYYNENMAIDAMFNLNTTIGEFFPTVQHYLRYRVELEKVDTEFSQIQAIKDDAGKVIKTVAQQVREKYYYLKSTGTANSSVADIKTKLALWKSKNNLAYFDYRMGIMTMLDLMKKQHPDLVDRFKFIQDLTTQYDTDTKKANFFINDLEDPMLVAVYKENLAKLKNSEYPEVAELFQLFDHIAIMQAGASGSGMTNLSKIIDQNKFYDFIETSIGTTEILRELDAGMDAFNKGIKLKDIKVPILDSFIEIFNGQVVSNWSSRKRGMNLMVEGFDTAGAGKEVNRLSTRNVKGYTKFEGLDIPYPKLTLNNLLIDAAVTTQPSINLPKSETKINIYASTGENASLSNFAERPVSNALGVDFRNVEAAFQYAKINWSTGDNSDIAMKLQTASGSEAKSLGKKIKGLDTKAWDKNSSAIMKNIIKESFQENPKALAKLLATGSATLTHTQDKTKWGSEFPKLLMEVRDELGGTQSSTSVKEGIDVTSKTLELNVKFIESVKDKMVAVIIDKILSVEDAVVQKKLNEALLVHFGIDNTGDKLVIQSKSSYTGPNISIALAEKQFNKHVETDEMMANQSTLAIGKETENISRASAATYYTDDIKLRSPNKLASKATKFKATDSIWIYGSHTYESSYAGKWSKDEWETAVGTDFNKNYIGLIDKAIKADVRTFYVGTASGIDALAIKYLKEKGYYPIPRYHVTGKYFEFVKMDEKTEKVYSGINPGKPSIMLGNDLGFNFIGDAKLKDEINKMSADELATGIAYDKVKASIYSKLSLNRGTAVSLMDNLVESMGSPLVADSGLGFGIYLQYVEQVMLDLRNDVFTKRNSPDSSFQLRRLKNLLESNPGMPMNFKDNSPYKDEMGVWRYRKMQPQFAGKYTFDLVVSGDRTRTTRTQREMDALLNLYKLRNPQDLVGLIVPITENTDKGFRKAYVQITKIADFTQEYQNETWEKEGWVKDVTDRLVGNYPYAVEFKLVSNNTITEEDINNLKPCKS